jgi:hypothetical protein
MYDENIFIHWLNDTSYYNYENIKDCKNIIYKVKNKYYKIKTFGFVIILGDCGKFLVEAKKDVIITGFVGHVDKEMKNPHKMIMNRATNCNIDIILRCYDMLTSNELKNSIAYQILFNLKEYNSQILAPMWKLWSIPITNNLSTLELLDFYYKKYGVDKYTKNKNTILIKI